MNKPFKLEAFESLPQTLKPSDYVDFLLFFIGEKSCVRLGFNEDCIYKDMIRWCKDNRLSYVVSKAGFMYISKRQPLAWFAKIVDDSTLNHTFLFGKILRYPTCCSKKVASIGECGIDEYEKSLIQNNVFQFPYHIINPEGYVNGYSLISHIPCCVSCKKSLKIAIKAYEIIEKNSENPAFYRWTNHWLHKIMEDK